MKNIDPLTISLYPVIFVAGIACSAYAAGIFQSFRKKKINVNAPRVRVRIHIGEGK